MYAHVRHSAGALPNTLPEQAEQRSAQTLNLTHVMILGRFWHIWIPDSDSASKIIQGSNLDLDIFLQNLALWTPGGPVVMNSEGSPGPINP